MRRATGGSLPARGRRGMRTPGAPGCTPSALVHTLIAIGAACALLWQDVERAADARVAQQC